MKYPTFKIKFENSEEPITKLFKAGFDFCISHDNYLPVMGPPIDIIIIKLTGHKFDEFHLEEVEEIIQEDPDCSSITWR